MSTKAGPATPGTAAAPATATAAVPSHSVEYNHQHFTGLINQLVDASLNEEAKLKAAQEISYNLEVIIFISAALVCTTCIFFNNMLSALIDNANAVYICPTD